MDLNELDITKEVPLYETHEQLKDIIKEAVDMRFHVKLTDAELSQVVYNREGDNRYTFTYKTLPLGLVVQMSSAFDVIRSVTYHD